MNNQELLQQLLDGNEPPLTCLMCPAQWHGRMPGGESVYVRYRWGHLDVGFGPADGHLDDAVHGGDDQYALSVRLGGGYHGFIEWSGVCAAVRENLTGQRALRWIQVWVSVPWLPWRISKQVKAYSWDEAAQYVLQKWNGATLDR